MSIKPAKKLQSNEGAERVAPRAGPRERLLSVAHDLFSQLGIRGVGVEAIAEAAGTNKMTLYRHFGSKDELVTEWLRGVADVNYAQWDELEQAHPGDAQAQLLAWIAGVEDWLATSGERGCLYSNSLAELPEPTHPARAVIKAHQMRQRQHLADLLRKANVRTPETVADELFFLAEGAKVSVHGIGTGMEDIAARFARVARAALASAEMKAARKRS